MSDSSFSSLSDSAWDALDELARIEPDAVAVMPVSLEDAAAELVRARLAKFESFAGFPVFTITEQGRELWEAGR